MPQIEEKNLPSKLMLIDFIAINLTILNETLVSDGITYFFFIFSFSEIDEA